MRIIRRMSGLTMLFASLLIAGQAGAKTLDFQGTLEITVSWVGEIIVHGSGVSTVNDTSGGAHLSTLRLAGGITGSGTVPITDPNQTGTLKSIRIAATIGTGTLTGISGAPPMGQNKLPIKGMTRICIFSPSCITNLPMNNTSNGTRGGGLGGLLTIGGMGSIRVSLWGAPWTLATVGATHQTGKGNFVTLSRVGFVHGAASGTNSSTAVNSGVIQMIAPQTATTIGTTGNSSAIALFNIMTLRFIPEPGLLLLLGAGVVGLGLLGRSRMKT